jgi:NAD(P)-dependent dehydrogenase (short-subunit alcohol dehydrogenase family)
MNTPTHTAIVTGASRGIGAAVAALLAGDGSAVALVARSDNALAAQVDAIENSGGRAMAIPADIADPDACRRVAARVLERWERIDALINNAGTFTPMATIADSNPLDWQAIVATNLMGPYYLTRFSLEALRRSRGRVIQVSSGASEKAIVAAGAYCITKAGLNHFTRVLAAEEPKIVSVAVRPGVVDTAMQDTIRRDGQGIMPPEQIAFYRRIHREGRLVAPAVPARAIAWLARYAPPALSGGYVSYDDPHIMGPASAVFGAPQE